MAGSSGGGGGGGGVPPGFRFHPTDEELLHFYLKKKVSFQKFDMEVIREVDLNKIEPWDLQEKCKIGSSAQNEWYFFSHKDRKYPTGSRTNRATSAGFWKATGRDKCIRNSFNKIGMRKTLVFYRGRAPHGQKTDWIMHEYRLEDSDHPHDHPHSTTQEDGWVICRVFKKKTLIKIGISSTSSEGRGGGGGMITNSSDHQLNMSSTTSASNSCNPAARSIFRNQYLVHPHHMNTDLNVYNIPAPHDHHHFPQQDFISTHHPHISTNVYHHHNLSTTDYDDHRHQPQSVMTTNMQVKQFMTNSNVNVRDHDCESATPASAAAAYNNNIECEDHSSQPNLDQWDNRGLHVITNPTTTTSSSINQINHPSEMDFWAYGK